MNIGIWSLIGIVGSILVSAWAVMRYVVSQHMRLDDNLSKNLLPYLQKAKLKLELNNEISINKRYPTTYSSLLFMRGIFMYFSRSERLLTAGWQSKETISEIYYLRWQRKKVEAMIHSIVNSQEHVNVMALTPWGTDKLGELMREDNPIVYIDDEQYEDIEKDVQGILATGKGKSSALLYGAPGTGKTRLIKYFSVKYNLPIYSVYLNPEFNNLDILLMFNDIPDRCIVLFEDFDNYFDKRECIMKNDKVKFTFDAILSALDGVYNDYNQVFFFMTCNNIDRIDVSIKDRPSRMKFVREITGPSYKKRLEILEGNDELAELTEGMTTDKVFFANSLQTKYSSSEIMQKIAKAEEALISNVVKVEDEEKS
jgi:predicted AAA+ superfamily ATPase